MHYDCCTGQHKVTNKGARGRRGVVILLTSDATSMCVGADQEHSSQMGEHCLGCSTLPTFYHEKRSHALVTQCVHVRTCKNPQRGAKRRGGACLSRPTCRQKQGPRTHTQSTLCYITLLAGLTKCARMHKHANETRAGSDARSRLNAPMDAAAPGRAFPASRQALQAPQ